MSDSSKPFQGKVVLVTGASRGIGAAIAKAFAREGAMVLVNYLQNTAAADEVVQACQQLGGDAMALQADVRVPQAVTAMVAQALLETGRIDVVVNNAGILRDRFFHKMSVDEWDSVMKVHLYGGFFVSRAAAPFFKAQESGNYIHMTSTSGLVGNFGQANYSAAKLGITALSKSIALDMLKFNVRSNCIAPFAWSRMIGSIPTDTPEEQARVDRIKQMTPAKIAPLAVALASDESAHVNGQVFAVRNNEIFLMSQPRPLRSVHRSEGWTPQSVLDQAMPALQSSFFDLERSGDVFSWDPI